MLARKDHNHQGQKLPTQFEEKIQILLAENYNGKFDAEKHIFEVHGFSYSTEVILTASLVNIHDELLPPVTYHVSADLEEATKMDQLLDLLVDSMGLFFDEYFSVPDWNNFLTFWEEMEFKKSKLFYKVTRENIAASLAADLLLNEESEKKLH